MPIFTVREYAFISIAYEGCPESSLEHAYISESAFNHLCKLLGSFKADGTRLFELAGRKKIKLDQYVGIIETPCGVIIEILPKHIEITSIEDKQEIINKERNLLQNMLKVSLHLPYREAGSANLKNFRHPLHEWVITQFLKAFKTLVQKGLRFDYNRVQEDQKFLRGQLRYVKHMRQSPTQKHIFPIEHDIYELNRAENRLIKTALEIVCKKTNDASNWKMAHELQLMTHEIPKSDAIQQDFKKWQSNRLLTLYDNIKPWTELILGKYIPVATQGNWHGMSLLFPMEKLFEYYVAYHLRRELKAWDVKTQFSSQHICKYDGKPIFRLRPDIHIENKETKKKVVLDTKWKLLNQNDIQNRFGLKDSDIQQMFAYSYFYLKHTSEVILIYPFMKEKFDKPLLDFQINIQAGSAKIRVVPFELENPQNIRNFLFI